MRVERTFRGITVRLAVHYLENLGGELVASEGDLAEPGSAATVAGDGWRVDLASERVRVGPSLALTEVSATFEREGADDGGRESGNERGGADLDRLVDAFAQKAMRAGG